MKVMQVLYAIEHSNAVSAKEATRILEKSIEKSYSLLTFTLALPVRIADYIRKESEIKSSKLLPTEQDRQFSTRLVDNPVIAILRSDKNVSSRLKLVMNDEEATLVKDLFRAVSKEPEYKQYCTHPEPAAGQKEIITFIFSKVIAKNPSYLQYVEDNFPECINELNKINCAITEAIEKLNPASNDGLPQFPAAETEEQFAKELLEKTLLHRDYYTELIQPKLKNWDLDRIARLDMILMRMALCELLCFEQIPVKVSINEYVDLSKIYSTPRSKDFINGILDNVMHELREKNEIRKTGRGLVE